MRVRFIRAGDAAQTITSHLPVTQQLAGEVTRVMRRLPP
jgi:hypothetical protein